MVKKDSWEPLLRAMTDDVRRLDSVTRFSSIPVAVPETVSQHSFWVATYSAMLVRHLRVAGIMEAVLIHALTHDLAECVTGDVVRTFKYSTPEFKKAVDAAEEELTDKLPGAIKDLYAAADDAAPGKAEPRVRMIVKAADWISLYQYMRREAARGNREIIPYFARMESELDGQAAAGGELSGLFTEMWAGARDVARDCFGASYFSPAWRREV